MANAFGQMTTKQEHIKYLTWTILIWSTINLMFNLIGLGTKELLRENDSYFDLDILLILKHLGFQSLIFGLSLSISFLLTVKRQVSLYSFPVVQFLIFHFIFLIGLETEDNQYYFVSSWTSFELSYLLFNQQELIDIISVFNPMGGTFEDGVFIVGDLFRLYSVWILLTLIYFFTLTWLTGTIMNRIESTGHNKKFMPAAGDV